MPRCSGTKLDGSPCERIVGESQRFCYAHDPVNKEQRRAAASKAGRVKPASELRSVKKELRDIAKAVRDGRIETGRASVFAQVYGVLLRAIEQDRRQRELQELEERLEAIEEAQKSASSPARRGRSWAR